MLFAGMSYLSRLQIINQDTGTKAPSVHCLKHIQPSPVTQCLLVFSVKSSRLLPGNEARVLGGL